MSEYQKTVWVSGGPPALDAPQLNKIEQGIYDAHAELHAHEARTDNPHNVTAEQVGAVRKVGDTMIGGVSVPPAFSIVFGDRYEFRYNPKLNYVDVRCSGVGVLRIDEHGNLLVPGKVYYMWPAYDGTAQVDDLRQIDDTQTFMADDGFEAFLSYLLGVASQEVPIQF